MNIDLALIYFWMFLYSWGYQRGSTEHNIQHSSQFNRVQLEITDLFLAVFWPYWVYRVYIKGA